MRVHYSIFKHTAKEDKIIRHLILKTALGRLRPKAEYLSIDYFL